MAIQFLTCDALKKCDGTTFNPLADSIVDCASLTDLILSQDPETVICKLLGNVPSSGGSATPTTQLVGADCQTYTLPPVPVDITVSNFEVVGNDLVITEDDGTTHAITSTQLLSMLGLVDCAGAAIAPNTPLVTCADTDTFLSADDLLDCNGKQFDLKLGIASCADIQALQDQIDNLITQVTDITTILNNAEPVEDCAGNPLGQLLPN